MGGNPNPVGSPPASAGVAATGAGGGGWWAPDEWAQWRRDSWYSAPQTYAPAGAQSASAGGPWQSSQTW
eukprot:7140030-Alexandrium_andersonii.AAC.1